MRGRSDLSRTLVPCCLQRAVRSISVGVEHERSWCHPHPYSTGDEEHSEGKKRRRGSLGSSHLGRYVQRLRNVTVTTAVLRRNIKNSPLARYAPSILKKYVVIMHANLCIALPVDAGLEKNGLTMGTYGTQGCKCFAFDEQALEGNIF